MWIKQNLIALDQLLNALLGGWADETLSSRAWRARDKHHTYKFIDAVFWWDPNHCYNSWLSERRRQQSAPEFRCE
jgi:hypothetical protein